MDFTKRHRHDLESVALQGLNASLDAASRQGTSTYAAEMTLLEQIDELIDKTVEEVGHEDATLDSPPVWPFAAHRPSRSSPARSTS